MGSRYIFGVEGEGVLDSSIRHLQILPFLFGCWRQTEQEIEQDHGLDKDISSKSQIADLESIPLVECTTVWDSLSAAGQLLKIRRRRIQPITRTKLEVM